MGVETMARRHEGISTDLEEPTDLKEVVMAAHKGLTEAHQEEG